MGRVSGTEVVGWVCIEHASTCPVSQPGFMPMGGITQCNCGFGQRLKVYLDSKQIDPSEPAVKLECKHEWNDQAICRLCGKVDPYVR